MWINLRKEHMIHPTINVAKRVATLETVIITCANGTKTIYWRVFL